LAKFEKCPLSFKKLSNAFRINAEGISARGFTSLSNFAIKIFDTCAFSLGEFPAAPTIDGLPTTCLILYVDSTGEGKPVVRCIVSLIIPGHKR
jgi:hypothetical protein